MQVSNILAASYPSDIVENLINSYKEVERNFRLSNWKTSELDAGHFVESVRRLIEWSLLGSYPSFSESLGSFNNSVLGKYESASGHESLRILIPRTLYSIYCIRNKRGVGHVGEISPNEADATYILYAVKWVLSELVRLASKTSPDEAARVIHQLVERQIEAVWDDGDSFMILDKKFKAKERILIALYKKDGVSDSHLQKLVGYKNFTAFKKLLVQLKKECFLDYTEAKACKLSPLGVLEAEKLIA